MIEGKEWLHHKERESGVCEIIEDSKSNVHATLIYFSNYASDAQSNIYIPYSQRILYQWVEELEIPVEVLPINPRSLNNAEIREALYDIFQSTTDFEIVGISVDYETVQELITLSNIIKSTLPQSSFIVAWWQGTSDIAAREYLLNAWVDAVNVGHAQPFFDVLSKIDKKQVISKELLFDYSEWLLATAKQPNVPRWKFPDIYPFPLTPFDVLLDEENKKEYLQLRIPHYQNCPNQCDYCCSEKVTESQHIFDNIVDTIRDQEYINNIDCVKFEWPTFEWKIVDNSIKILKAITDKQGYAPKTKIVMDSNQFQKQNYDKTVQLLQECNAKVVHIGINSVDEVTAHEVGRKYHGKVRSALQLNDEIEWVLHFVKSTEINTIKVDILLSPFDSPDTIQKILQIGKELLVVQRETGKNIEFFLSPLIPYPWTKFFEKHKNMINFVDYGQFKSSIYFDPSIWKDNDDLFGLTLLKSFSAPFLTSCSIDYTQNDKFKEQYLQFLALSMTYQYIHQGKTALKELDILFPEFQDDPWVQSIFESLHTQSVPLSNIQ